MSRFQADAGGHLSRGCKSLHWHLIVVSLLMCAAGCRPSQQPVQRIAPIAPAEKPRPEPTADTQFCTPPPEGAVWLSDLPEQNASVGYGTFTKGSAFWGGDLHFLGFTVPHGLCTHPDSFVDYNLGKKYRTLRVTAAMDDTTGTGPEQPVLFRIYADDKLISELGPLSKQGGFHDTLLDVTDVDRLRLETVYDTSKPGHGLNAHAIWLDPWVSPVAAKPEWLARFGVEYRKFYQDLDVKLNLARKLFGEDDFAELEKLFEEARVAEPAPDGFPVLDRFYDLFGAPLAGGESAVLKHFDRLKRWQEKQPDSVTPLVIEASGRTAYAFAARGGDWAINVTGEGGKLYLERLAVTGDLLERATQLDKYDSRLMTDKIWFARNTSGSREYVDECIEQICAHDPRFLTAYTAMVHYLAPRWGGKPGDQADFAGTLRERIGGKLGDALYAFVVIKILRSSDGASTFDAQDYDQKILSGGLRTLMIEFPVRGEFLHDACRLSYMARDREFTRELLQLISPESYLYDSWRDGRRFAAAERWAFAPQPAAAEQQIIDSGSDTGLSAVCFLADGEHILSSSYSGGLPQLVDIAKGRRVSTSLDGMPDFVLVAAHPKENIFAVGNSRDETNSVRIFLCRQVGEQISAVPLDAQKKAVRDLCFSADGSTMATVGGDNAVYVWQWQQLPTPRRFEHSEALCHVALSPDGSKVASSTQTGVVRVWDVEKQTADVVKEPVGTQTGLAFTPDGEKLLMIGGLPTIGVFDLASQEVRSIPIDVVGRAWAIAACPQGTLCAIGTLGYQVALYDWQAGSLKHKFLGHWDGVNAVAFSPNGQRLGSASSDGTIRLWDVRPYLAEKPGGEAEK